MKNLLTLLFLAAFSVNAQTVLLMHDVENDKASEEGPGKLRYTGQYYGGGLMIGAPENDSSAINYGKSLYFFTGSKLKIETNPLLAFGLETMFQYRHYSIAQTNEKLFQAPIQHKKENFHVLDYQADAYMRINFTKKGNHFGKYLDFGVYGAYNFYTRLVTVDKVNSAESKQNRIVYSRLRYINRIEYGGIIRLGTSILSAHLKYRASDLFKSFTNDLGTTTNFPELPRFQLGIGFDIPGRN